MYAPSNSHGFSGAQKGPDRKAGRVLGSHAGRGLPWSPIPGSSCDVGPCWPRGEPVGQCTGRMKLSEAGAPVQPGKV